MVSSLTHRLQRLVELESRVAYRVPPPTGESEFDYLPGQIPVLISAPHGAAHTRNGRIKQEDEFTAGIARLLAEESGAHVLFAHHQSTTDPNFYRGVPYKQRLRQIHAVTPLRLVIDLHGSNPRRDFGIAVGTLCGRSLPRRALLLETLGRYNFHEQGDRLQRVDVDGIFTGGGGVKQETVTRYVWEELGIYAAQLELNAQLRVIDRGDKPHSPSAFRPNPQRVEHTLDALLAVIAALLTA